MLYLLETYGCQMNEAESTGMENLLAERGWQRTPEHDQADLVMINTCSVRETAENRAWGRIKLFAAIKRQRKLEGKPLRLLVFGCMAERLKDQIHQFQPEVDFVLGNFQKTHLESVLISIESHQEPVAEASDSEFSFAVHHYKPGTIRTLVPVMHGCNHFCSYCIVPYVRGREISRDPGHVLSELDVLSQQGVRECTFLGQNINTYNWKDESGSTLDFPGLLLKITNHIKSQKNSSLRWLRFLTSHPKDLSTRLVDVMAREPLLCKHIHLCVQSGSDRILSAMNRGHDRRYFLDLVETIKSAIPTMSISTDILTGFPGETEADHQFTLDLMNEVCFSFAYMYYFNPRKGTPAAELPDAVDKPTKLRRLAEIIALQKLLTQRYLNGRIGERTEVLIERISRNSSAKVLARTQSDEMVVFAAHGSAIGRFARVTLESLTGTTFQGAQPEYLD